MDLQREDMLVLLDKAKKQWSSSFPPVRNGEEIDWRQRKWLLWMTFHEDGVLKIAEGRLKRDQLSTAEGKIAFDRQQCERDLREAHGPGDQGEHHSPEDQVGLKSYGYDGKDINMRQMMLDSLPDLYGYEQLRGTVKYECSAEKLLDGPRALVEQAAREI
ncbi:uncharacterized protein PHALS_08034 [Plasmopara halstedii]|uniref:Uncharacterized protein n=1 Tax=Plasmopara halstedii TaxID=4781 RepID=A0A0N7L8M8_PLAHL|nr:uncharacterized protein PHALS_08034 [Plasmopara halstedii]CEG50315.1 hypothetical protein PHALS_08034 [Plasmopara halstedii]|eukprot:XP_024586684.1 hypothetical protein PHALS_08034 [Plasmopara halstedii]